MNRSIKLAGCALFTIIACATTSRAAIVTKTVKYESGGSEFLGYLAYDDSHTAKRPAILVAPEWWGLNDYAKSRARQLAELGYIAFAADLYGQGKVTTDAKQAAEWAGPFYKDRAELRRRIRAAYSTMLAQPAVDDSKTAAIGYCFGGMAALDLARSGTDLAGIVSFHGGLAPPVPASAEKIKARILIEQGADDSFISPEELQGFLDEMRKAGVDYRITLHGGAKHAFTNPDAGSFHVKGVEYNEKADQRSWSAMKAFFNALFDRAEGKK